jgi:hypothetical protein
VTSSETSAYWSLIEETQDRSALSPQERLATFCELSRAYHGPWDEARDSFTDPVRLNYTWFQNHLLDAPWNRGRVVLVGGRMPAKSARSPSASSRVAVAIDRVDQRLSRLAGCSSRVLAITISTGHQ